MQTKKYYLDNRGSLPVTVFKGKRQEKQIALKKFLEDNQKVKLPCEDMLAVPCDVLCGSIYEKNEIICKETLGCGMTGTDLRCCFQNEFFEISDDGKSFVTGCPSRERIEFKITKVTD